MTTITAASLFGNSAPGRKRGDVQEDVVADASGMPFVQKKGPAMIWIGLVLALIALRIAWEVA